MIRLVYVIKLSLAPSDIALRYYTIIIIWTNVEVNTSIICGQ